MWRVTRSVWSFPVTILLLRSFGTLGSHIIAVSSPSGTEWSKVWGEGYLVEVNIQYSPSFTRREDIRFHNHRGCLIIQIWPTLRFVKLNRPWVTLKHWTYREFMISRFRMRFSESLYFSLLSRSNLQCPNNRCVFYRLQRTWIFSLCWPCLGFSGIFRFWAFWNSVQTYPRMNEFVAAGSYPIFIHIFPVPQECAGIIATPWYDRVRAFQSRAQERKQSRTT